MCFWIADFFEHGHTLDEIYNMSFFDYQFLVASLGEKRNFKGGSSTSHNLRPVQKSAIQKAKELNKK